MQGIKYFITFIILASCQANSSNVNTTDMIEQSSLENTKIKDYKFLECMYQDSYFPKFLVDKCKGILLNLCNEIESKKPADLSQLYNLSHRATEQLNDLQEEFFANGSEIETGARECLAIDFEAIADAYGFDADIEELIATREW